MKEGTITFERLYNAPVSRVWKAITDKNEMKEWYFDIAEFTPEVGFEFKFYGGTEEKPYLHICKITEVILHKKLTYSWKYDGYKGISFVSFELSEEGQNTRLTLTHRGLDSFDVNNNPDLVANNFKEGWNHILDISLKPHLEN